MVCWRMSESSVNSAGVKRCAGKELYVAGTITAAQAAILFLAYITMRTLIGHFARVVLVCKVRAVYYRPIMFLTSIADAVIVMFMPHLTLLLTGAGV